MEIRPATPDDAHALWQAESTTAAFPGQLASRPEEISVVSVNARIRMASQAGCFFVAEADGQMRATGLHLAGFLPDFGGPHGAIIACRHAHEDIFDVAVALGLHASGLNPYHYEIYERDSFSETLNDWGWFGDPSATPTWFVGGHRKHGGRK